MLYFEAHGYMDADRFPPQGPRSMYMDAVHYDDPCYKRVGKSER